MTELSQATAFPQLAVLSAAAHGNDDDGAEVAVAALGACRGLDTPRATRYADFVLSSLGEAARHALEARETPRVLPDDLAEIEKTVQGVPGDLALAARMIRRCVL